MKTEHNLRLQRTTALSRFLRTTNYARASLRYQESRQPLGDAVAAEPGVMLI